MLQRSYVLAILVLGLIGLSARPSIAQMHDSRQAAEGSIKAALVAAVEGQGPGGVQGHFFPATAPPNNPTNLAANVSGTTVTLNWTAPATGEPPTAYFVEAGGVSGAANLAAVPTNSTQPSLVVSNVPAGTYFVRVRATNDQGVSSPSNEIQVVVGAAGPCPTPGAPGTATFVVNGSSVTINWGTAAGAASYVVQAGFVPGGADFGLPAAGGSFTFNSAPSGTYYVRVRGVNACGTGPASNEVIITVTGGAPAPPQGNRTPDPAPGQQLPLPNIQAFVEQASAQRPDLLANSCPGGIKYRNNPWLDYIVDRLRTLDTRWGYNKKPTRTAADNGGLPVIAAGDEVAYHYSAGPDEGSPDVYLIDLLFGHCGDNPSVTYRDFTGQEPGIWTGVGRF